MSNESHSHLTNTTIRNNPNANANDISNLHVNVHIHTTNNNNVNNKLTSRKRLRPQDNDVLLPQSSSTSSVKKHKDVERNRRDLISSGIDQLAALIPHNETQKGKVILGAVQYIRELKQIEASNLEKWQVEKAMCQQVIQDLTNSVNQLIGEKKALTDQLARLRDAHGLPPLE